MHAYLSSGAKGLCFGLSFPLLLYIVYDTRTETKISCAGFTKNNYANVLVMHGDILRCYTTVYIYEHWIAILSVISRISNV